ncbi:MAG: acetoacetate--CoA ligase [Ardenticatenaceae bacterium]|nr:acetoacetate--CoA ligase [Ardenticatenaceae bacterium]
MSEPIREGQLLWEPSAEIIKNANLTTFMRWLSAVEGRHFENYEQLWWWSVTEIEDFWFAIWNYFEVVASRQATHILPNRQMPGAVWFPGARLNYAENVIAKMPLDRPVIYYRDEEGPVVEIGKDDLVQQVAALAAALKEMGVKSGDRVVAYLPNIPETIISLLAAASLGAIWSSCSPDFGSRSVLDRFTQIEPTVLIAVDGYRYGGKPFNRLGVVAELQANLPTLKKTILIPLLSDGRAADALAQTVRWSDIQAKQPRLDQLQLTFAQLPFEHPLWVLYSSGTTGLPKPIVQGHGGILLEHVKATALHLDLKKNDRFFWYTSTGWMMWNFIVGGLLSGASIVLYNGSPGYPNMNALWRLAEDIGITYFGTSAAFVSACIKAKIKPNEKFDLNGIRGVGSTGSPLSLAGFQWIYDYVNRHLALESLSGGTDLCTAFVGGARINPIFAGELQGPSLGAKVLAFDEQGKVVLDEVGELVIAEPMPSMPLYFWNDPEMTRYKESYFAMYPGIWRHGDWIKLNKRRGAVIYGRSDSTINRGGIRMGTSEIYQVVESFDEILDSLVIDLSMLEREPFMPMFVVLREGAVLDDELISRIHERIRSEISPRHIPNEIIAIEEIPYTLSGKKMEVPIRKILLGRDVKGAANPGAMRNPQALEFFIKYAGAL